MIRPKTIREEMILNAVAHNSALSKEHLNKRTDIIILRNTHPNERPEFAKRLYKAGILSKEQAQEFTEIL